MELEVYKLGEEPEDIERKVPHPVSRVCLIIDEPQGYTADIVVFTDTGEFQYRYGLSPLSLLRVARQLLDKLAPVLPTEPEK